MARRQPLTEATRRIVAQERSGVGSTVGAWIEVIGGNRWQFGAADNLLVLTVAQLAKVLSQINRFTGHTDAAWPYSVAQHSVFVSELLDVDARWAMAGLLHDAPEMIIGDVSTPLKRYIGKEAFAPLEREEWKALAVICDALNVSRGVLDVLAEDFSGAVIKHADLVALVTEKRDLLSPEVDWQYFGEIPRHCRRIIPVSAPVAARRFVKRFNELQARLS